MACDCFEQYGEWWIFRTKRMASFYSGWIVFGFTVRLGGVKHRLDERLFRKTGDCRA